LSKKNHKEIVSLLTQSEKFELTTPLPIIDLTPLFTENSQSNIQHTILEVKTASEETGCF
jgi:hypothetical protein